MSCIVKQQAYEGVSSSERDIKRKEAELAEYEKISDDEKIIRTTPTTKAQREALKKDPAVRREAVKNENVRTSIDKAEDLRSDIERTKSIKREEFAKMDTAYDNTVTQTINTPINKEVSKEDPKTTKDEDVKGHQEIDIENETSHLNKSTWEMLKSKDKEFYKKVKKELTTVSLEALAKRSNSPDAFIKNLATYVEKKFGIAEGYDDFRRSFFGKDDIMATSIWNKYSNKQVIPHIVIDLHTGKFHTQESDPHLFVDSQLKAINNNQIRFAGAHKLIGYEPSDLVILHKTLPVLQPKMNNGKPVYEMEKDSKGNWVNKKGKDGKEIPVMEPKVLSPKEKMEAKLESNRLAVKNGYMYLGDFASTGTKSIYLKLSKEDKARIKEGKYNEVHGEKMSQITGIHPGVFAKLNEMASTGGIREKEIASGMIQNLHKYMGYSLTQELSPLQGKFEAHLIGTPRQDQPDGNKLKVLYFEDEGKQQDGQGYHAPHITDMVAEMHGFNRNEVYFKPMGVVGGGRFDKSASVEWDFRSLQHPPLAKAITMAMSENPRFQAIIEKYPEWAKDDTASRMVMDLINDEKPFDQIRGSTCIKNIFTRGFKKQAKLPGDITIDEVLGNFKEGEYTMDKTGDIINMELGDLGVKNVSKYHHDLANEKASIAMNAIARNIDHTIPGDGPKIMSDFINRIRTEQLDKSMEIIKELQKNGANAIHLIEKHFGKKYTDFFNKEYFDKFNTKNITDMVSKIVQEESFASIRLGGTRPQLRAIPNVKQVTEAINQRMSVYKKQDKDGKELGYVDDNYVILDKDEYGHLENLRPEGVDENGNPMPLRVTMFRDPVVSEKVLCAPFVIWAHEVPGWEHPKGWETMKREDKIRSGTNHPMLGQGAMISEKLVSLIEGDFDADTIVIVHDPRILEIQDYMNAQANHVFTNGDTYFPEGQDSARANPVEGNSVSELLSNTASRVMEAKGSVGKRDNATSNITFAQRMGLIDAKTAHELKLLNGEATQAAVDSKIIEGAGIDKRIAITLGEKLFAKMDKKQKEKFLIKHSIAPPLIPELSAGYIILNHIRGILQFSKAEDFSEGERFQKTIFDLQSNSKTMQFLEDNGYNSREELRKFKAEGLGFSIARHIDSLTNLGFDLSKIPDVEFFVKNKEKIMAIPLERDFVKTMKDNTNKIFMSIQNQFPKPTVSNGGSLANLGQMLASVRQAFGEKNEYEAKYGEESPRINKKIAEAQQMALTYAKTHDINIAHYMIHNPFYAKENNVKTTTKEIPIQALWDEETKGQFNEAMRIAHYTKSITDLYPSFKGKEVEMADAIRMYGPEKALGILRDSLVEHERIRDGFMRNEDWAVYDLLENTQKMGEMEDYTKKILRVLSMDEIKKGITEDIGSTPEDRYNRELILSAVDAEHIKLLNLDDGVVKNILLQKYIGDDLKHNVLKKADEAIDTQAGSPLNIPPIKGC